MTTGNRHEHGIDRRGEAPPPGMTDLEYESVLEATRTERARPALEARWAADPHWRAFRALCYPDGAAPGAEAIRQGVQRLINAAGRGHAPAQCRLATELHLGEGRLGIDPDVRKAARWYRLAARQGEPLALQALAVLRATHPHIFGEES